ncbi:MAG: hypothetical protein KDA90_13225 [Planctomycetaceae bacterium]|nr:hypothetical protein [Planctomycetaceae bacterium]
MADSLMRRAHEFLADQHHLKPGELAQLLVRQKVLSSWQGRQLLEGRTSTYAGEYKILERRSCDTDVVAFVAEDIRTQRLVMCQLERRLKRWPDPPTTFQQLFQWWRDRRHTNLIALREFPLSDAADFSGLVVLDYEEGPALSEVVRARGPLPWRQAARLVAQFAELLQQLKPIWLSKPLELSDFHLGHSGQLRWNPLSSMLSISDEQIVAEECRWGQQIGLLFLLLVGDASAAEWLLRFQRRRAVTLMSYPAWKQLPQEARHMIERLVTTKAAGLDRTASWFRDQSTAVPGAMSLVPGRLHRSQLHHLLRRTPMFGAGSLPTCRWSDLTGEALAPDLPQGVDSLEPDGETEQREEETTLLASSRPGRVWPDACCPSVAGQRSRQGPGKKQWWLYIALWGIVLALALAVWLQQERKSPPAMQSLSMSSLGKMQVGQRKLLRKREFCHVIEFSIGPLTI